jgi:hypothetical protein
MGVKLGVSHFNGITKAEGVRESIMGRGRRYNWAWGVGSKSRPDKFE